MWAIAEAVLDKLERSGALVDKEADTNTPTQGNPQLTTNEGDEDDDGGEVSGPRRSPTIKLAKWLSHEFWLLYPFISHADGLIDRQMKVDQLGRQINQPNLWHLIHMLLSEEEVDSGIYGFLLNTPAPGELPPFDERITIFSSAMAIFYSPSDQYGIGGMHCERIHATLLWRGGLACYDCIFVWFPELDTWDVTQVCLFFSFSIIDGQSYSCALLHEFQIIGDQLNEDTGMWMVEWVLDGDGQPSAHVVPLNSSWNVHAHLDAM